MPAAGEVVGVLVAFSLAKKVAFYGVARLYGFPRIYRKAVKLQRNLGAPEEAQRSFRMTLQVYFI